MFVATMFTITKILKQPKYPSKGEWIMKRKCGILLHNGGLCSHKNEGDPVFCFCRDMDEGGNHHSQQTNTKTENQTPHVLAHKWKLNNENPWTHVGEHHTTRPVRA